MDYAYTPYYCEENVYLLAAALVVPAPLRVLLITNQNRTCALGYQKAAPPGRLVVWDYHVVLLEGAGTGARIWDQDTRLAFPCGARDYLARTFPADASPAYAPRFRLIDAEQYGREFSSDRRHMRRADGTWLQPVPAWPPPRGIAAEQSHELSRLLDLADPRWGPVLDLAALRREAG